MSTLRFRMGMAEAENSSLRGMIMTMEAIKTVTRSQGMRDSNGDGATICFSSRVTATRLRELQEAPEVMDAPTILVSADSSEGDFRDAIDIRLDVVHPVPVIVVAFPAVTIVAILASHGEAI
ncbi:hypothetical protein Tco_0554106 [Tanacetum coccineum]